MLISLIEALSAKLMVNKFCVDAWLNVCHEYNALACGNSEWPGIFA